MHVQAMGAYEDILSGLERATVAAGNTSRLAEVLGEAPSLLTRWFKRERVPKLDKLAPVLDALGARVIFPGQQEVAPVSDYVFIQKALARPAAGGGSLETSGETEGGLVFKNTWLLSRTRSAPGKLRIMEVEGVSMAPTIDHGDVILMDQGNITLIPDRVYVIRKGTEIYVKRYRKAPEALLFMGDNRARDYEDVRVSIGEEDDFAVIGRVLWAGKEL